MLANGHDKGGGLERVDFKLRVNPLLTSVLGVLEPARLLRREARGQDFNRRLLCFQGGHDSLSRIVLASSRPWIIKRRSSSQDTGTRSERLPRMRQSASAMRCPDP